MYSVTKEDFPILKLPGLETALVSEHQIFPPPTEQILQPTKNVVTFDKYPIFSRVKLKLMAGPLEFELNKKTFV